MPKAIAALKGKKPAPAPKLGINDVIAKVRSKFGKNAIMRASEAEFIKVHRISSGIDAVDFSIGGGYPFGRFVHIYGGEAVAKTWMAMKAAAEVHRVFPEGIVVWNDLERVFDAKRARQVGMDLSRVELIQANTAEESLGIMEEMALCPSVHLHVVDSIAAIAPMSEMEGSMDDMQMGAAPRVMNKFFRRWLSIHSPKVNQRPGSFVILLNQVREKIGGWGNPKPKPTGGRGMRFFPSIAIEVSIGDRITVTSSDDDGDKTIIGHEVKLYTEKNNTFPPHRVGKFLLCTRPYEVRGYRVGANEVDNPRDLVRYAKSFGIVEESGKWLKHRDNSWNGKIDAQKFLAGNPAYARELKVEVMDAINQALGVYREEDAAKKQKAGKARIKGIRRKGATGKR